MNLNSDFNQRAIINSEDLPWISSPLPGVERRMLDRIGEEVARATSIVRYAPDSYFSAHNHDGGEELLVLEGTFSGEHGDYGPGTYVRNPVGSCHTPFSKEGCTIFVKLWQFEEGDDEFVRINTHNHEWLPGMVKGLSVMPLHSFASNTHKHEQVALVRWAPNTTFTQHRHIGGEEILVLEGTFADEHGTYPKGCWLRNPHNSVHTPFTKEGCTIYVKTGHLAEPIPHPEILTTLSSQT